MVDHADYKVIADLTDHIADASAHHIRYSDAEARAAINNIFGSDGKADADIDLDGHNLKGGNVILPDGSYIGIGPALERLEFYTAGKASFMGCNVGIGTTSPLTALQVHGSIRLGHIDGSATDQLRLYQGTGGTPDNYAFITANDNHLYFFNYNGHIILGTAEDEAHSLYIRESSDPYMALNWWFDGSSLGGTGMWIKTPRLGGSQNFQLGTADASSKFNVKNSTPVDLLTVDGLGKVTVPLHDNAAIGLFLGARLVTYAGVNTGGAGFRMLVVPN